MLNVMKRNALRILSALIIASALIGSVSAHQGRTDTNGGHTDNSTGEYHYHHGYPAHDHYDMDGDGDEDCPYDFKDQTGSSSGSSGYSSGSSSNYKTSTPTQKTETIVKTITEKVPYIPDWVFLVFGVSGIAIILLWRRVSVVQEQKESTEKALKTKIETLKKDVANMQWQRNKRAEEKLELSAKHRTEIAALAARNQMTHAIGSSRLNADLARVFGDDYLYRASGAPEGHTVDEKGLPIGTPSDGLPWGKEYTFYRGKTVFHRCDCCHARSAHITNAMLLDDHTPCKVCNPALPELDWVYRYNEHKEFLVLKANVNKE